MCQRRGRALPGHLGDADALPTKTRGKTLQAFSWEKAIRGRILREAAACLLCLKGIFMYILKGVIDSFGRKTENYSLWAASTRSARTCTVLEYGKDMIVVDCGVGFPEDDMYGVDLVIPDMTYLVKNQNKLRGMFITHGHEDHIGAHPIRHAGRELPHPRARAMTAGLDQAEAGGAPAGRQGQARHPQARRRTSRPAASPWSSST